ncbi:MAG: twin-arginine translocase TatA/TatE family subunit [Anaerolineales bacterium]|jgi:TatA/E family protein of Tat protein translocase
MPFGIQPWHLIVIAVVALLVFGPSRLPDIGRGMGRALREFREGTKEMTESFREEMKQNPSAPSTSTLTSAASTSAPTSAPFTSTLTSAPFTSAPTSGPVEPSATAGPYCTQCGNANPPGARFCSKCGAQLVA